MHQVWFSQWGKAAIDSSTPLHGEAWYQAPTAYGKTTHGGEDEEDEKEVREDECRETSLRVLMFHQWMIR